MIAWMLTTSINYHSKKLLEKYITEQEVKAYICTCGNVKFYIQYFKNEHKYICEKCNNKKFYDANWAWKHIDDFLYQNEDLFLPFSYYIEADNNKIISIYAVNIPHKVDLSNKKLFLQIDRDLV